MEPLRQIGELAVHLGEKLAVVTHLDLGQLGGAVGDRVAEPAQQRTPLRAVISGHGPR